MLHVVYNYIGFLFYFQREFLIFHTPQRLFKLDSEQDCRKCHSEQICDRFRHIDRQRLVGSQDMGHEIDQRDQKDKLPHHRHYNRLDRFSQRVEGHLACHLDAEQEHGSHIDPKSRPGVFHKLPRRM